MTNSFEGTILVNPNTTDVAVFLGQLFPRLGPKGIAAAAAQYTGMGTASVQAAAIMGEGESKLSAALLIIYPVATAIIICPTYALLSAFKGPTYKVSSNSIAVN